MSITSRLASRFRTLIKVDTQAIETRLQKQLDKELICIRQINRLQKHLKPIIKAWTGNRIRQPKSRWHRTYATYSWNTSFDLDFYLSKTDSIKNTLEIFEALEAIPDLEFKYSNDQPNQGYRKFNYIYFNANFAVGIYFKNSDSCKIVGTGKFVEETKIVCG